MKRFMTTAEETNGLLYNVYLTFDPKDYDGQVKNVGISGEFMFYKSNLTGNTDETGMMENKKKYVPAEYTPDMKPIGGYYYEEMKYNEDKKLYEITLKLPAGGYDYRFVVNGTLGEIETDFFKGWVNNYTADGTVRGITADDWVVDPQNKPTVVTASGIQHWSVFAVGEDKNNPWIPDSSLKGKGTVTFVSYNDINNTAQSLGVYLPAGYDKHGSKPYKVIYVSHGGGGNENDWYTLGGIDNIMDNLISQGRVQDEIVVTMNNAAYGSGADWNFKKIADNLFKCIIPYIEKIYNVSTDVKDRAFCGLSMGGLTTSYIYMHYPLKFGYFGIFSGAIAGGENFDLSSDDLKKPAVMLGCGEEDMAYNKTDIGLQKFQDEIRQKNIKFTPYYVAGSHDWFVWRRLFAYFIEKILWR